jgi:hypothetical protein
VERTSRTLGVTPDELRGELGLLIGSEGKSGTNGAGKKAARPAATKDKASDKAPDKVKGKVKGRR